MHRLECSKSKIRQRPAARKTTVREKTIVNNKQIRAELLLETISRQQIYHFINMLTGLSKSSFAQVAPRSRYGLGRFIVLCATL